jgi:hypothetical protein
MSHTLKDLVGQFDCVQRSLIFIYVGLEQGPNSFIYRPSSRCASRDQSGLFIEKGDQKAANARSVFAALGM